MKIAWEYSSREQSANCELRTANHSAPEAYPRVNDRLLAYRHEYFAIDITFC